MSTRTVPILAAILLARCATGPPRPVEIEPSDMCAFCKMAISQRQYAAEAVASGNTFKFDDIGCMLRFARQHGLNERSAAYFVHDYDGSGWLEADRARFVQSVDIPSPMASGLIATAKREAAERYAARFHGRLLGFAELWKP